jgi:hypothetical protein
MIFRELVVLGLISTNSKPLMFRSVLTRTGKSANFKVFLYLKISSKMNNITVTSRMERKIHCVQIELNINSLQTRYDNKELKFTKYFKIDSIPMCFTVWDSDYSQISNPPSVQKSLHLDVYDENVEEIECDFQEVTVKMENLIGTIKPKNGASHLSFWKNPSYLKSD